MSAPAKLIIGTVSLGGKVRPEEAAIGRRCPDSYVPGVRQVTVSSNRDKVSVVIYEGSDQQAALAEYDRAGKFLDRFEGTAHPYRDVRRALELVRDNGLSLDDAASRVLSEA